MKPLDTDLKASLHVLFQGRVCIVGVGNRQRRDDGAGPRVIDQRRPATRGVWLDAGVTPENFLEPIARAEPGTVLIVDAVAFGGYAGEVRLMDAATMDAVALSTHAVSLDMLCDYLVARTGACMKVMAIQPKRIAAGEGLSPPVEESVRELAVVLSDLLPHEETQCTSFH